MPWNWVVGQDRVVDVLRRSVAAGRVAQAYLFHGPDGSGKRVAALALAQALQCERRAEGEADPCGECTPCSKVERLLHPDLHVHLAQTSKASVEDITARLQALAEDPYAEVSFRRRPDLSDPEKSSNLKAFYSVDRIREINRELRYTPAEGNYKVSVLTDADTMQKAAANAFLKSLEEPTPRTVLVLTATRTDMLLPTVISRCQRIRFDALSVVQIEQGLIARGAAGPANAPLIARMADGSFTQALDLLQSGGLAERREILLGFLRASYKAQWPDLEPLIKQLTSLSREQLRDALRLMLGWVRDLVLMRELGNQAPLINVDQRESIQKFVNKLPDARLEDMSALVEHALRLIAGNVNTTLVLINLADGFSEAMRGRERVELF
jgi:DNA polymerase III subunit delta'